MIVGLFTKNGELNSPSYRQQVARFEEIDGKLINMEPIDFPIHVGKEVEVIGIVCFTSDQTLDDKHCGMFERPYLLKEGEMLSFDSYISFKLYPDAEEEDQCNGFDYY